MLVDSHCHLDLLDLTPFADDVGNVIQSAQENGVGYMLSVCTSMENIVEVLHNAHRFVNVFASVGVHPTEQGGHDPTIDELVTAAEDPCVVALGETGLDYFHCEGDLIWQQERFRRHLQAAKQVKKPVIVHSRQAAQDTIRLIKEAHNDDCQGVFHCFTESWEMAKAGLDLGFYISFSGIVTFKNAHALQEIAMKVPEDRLLVETDAPYLTPVPYRGQTNQPAYVRYVAECLAALRGVAYQQIVEKTTANFFDLFKPAQ